MNALVTGASRGIGRATAIALAEAGLDVAITARTLREGEGRDESDAGHGRPLPGSLEVTAADIEARGRRALPVVADLLDRASLVAAVERVLAEWGPIDVLVNNAVHTGPGSMVPFLDTTLEQLETRLEANVVAQWILIRAALPSMLERGAGRIVNVSSFVAYNDPSGPVGDGGWGVAYAASKGAFHRFAGIMAVELAGNGILAFNVDPGFVMTERMTANAGELGLAERHNAPPSVPAAAIAWLATSPDARELNGRTVRAQKLALERGLHADWRRGR